MEAEVKVEFWYDLASPESYLSAQRITDLSGKLSIALDWQPFLVEPIVRGGHVPEAMPTEAAYRRRDIERQCAAQGLVLVWPSARPRSELLATRVALVGARHAWGPAFARHAFRARFAEGRDLESESVLQDILKNLGLEADLILAQAKASASIRMLEAQIERALDRGILEAPTFAVGDEVFWGNDRLDHAIAWACCEAPERRAGRLVP